MIKSMTGYGKAESIIKNRKITVEIRSLNSKNLDLSLKTPSYYRSKEMNLRKLVGASVLRGKCDVFIHREMADNASSHVLNENLLKEYKDNLTEVLSHLELTTATDGEIMQSLLRMPDVLISEEDKLTEEEWADTEELVKIALEHFNNHRAREGADLDVELKSRIDAITKLLSEVLQYEDERVPVIKERIANNISKLNLNTELDQNRLEQEIIYYVEKLDITEEKVRLKSHLSYFIETLENASAQGKKLGFIAQELGREINTLGSKANHAELQKIVVLMKDELEKIKEQVLNVM